MKPHRSWFGEDGEIILADDRGVPTVYELQRRWTNPRHRAGQARLAVFDVLRSPHDGTVTSRPLRDRLQLLDEVPYSDTVVRIPHGPDGPDLFRIAVAHGTVVARAMRSKYRPGRSSSWLKFKRTDRLTCLATRWVPAGDLPSGAAIARLAEGRLHPAGVVRYGFTVHERRRVRDLLDDRRQLLIDVDCQEIAPNGRLRFPVYAATSPWPTCNQSRVAPQ